MFSASQTSPQQQVAINSIPTQKQKLVDQEALISQQRDQIVKLQRNLFHAQQFPQAFSEFIQNIQHPPNTFDLNRDVFQQAMDQLCRDYQSPPQRLLLIVIAIVIMTIITMMAAIRPRWR